MTWSANTSHRHGMWAERITTRADPGCLRRTRRAVRATGLPQLSLRECHRRSRAAELILDNAGIRARRHRTNVTPLRRRNAPADPESRQPSQPSNAQPPSATPAAGEQTGSIVHAAHDHPTGDEAAITEGIWEPGRQSTTRLLTCGLRPSRTDRGSWRAGPKVGPELVRTRPVTPKSVPVIAINRA